MRGIRVFVLCSLLVIWASACSDENPTNGSSSGVRDLAARLEAAGVGCTTLEVREPDSQAAEDPSPAPGGSAIPQMGSGGPVASESGFCVLDGATEFQGQPTASLILVFDDDAHLDRLPPKEMLAGGGPFPEQALVYGDTWEMFVVPVERAEEIAEALDGQVLRAGGS